MVRTRRRSPSSAVGGRRTGSRLRGDQGNDRWSSVPVSMTEQDATVRSTNYTARSPALAGPELEPPLVDHAGVHQNITFPCTRTRKRHALLAPESHRHPAGQGDRYRDIYTHLSRGRQVHRKLLSLARPACGERRRALWLFRQLKPSRDEYGWPATSKPGAPATAPLPRGQARSRWQSCSTGHHARPGLSYPSRHERTRRLAQRCSCKLRRRVSSRAPTPRLACADDESGRTYHRCADAASADTRGS